MKFYIQLSNLTRRNENTNSLGYELCLINYANCQLAITATQLEMNVDIN